MQAAVRRLRADCGVCFDGDADRAIFADEKGQLLDGDNLICLSALHLHRHGLLRVPRPRAAWPPPRRAAAAAGWPRCRPPPPS